MREFLERNFSSTFEVGDLPYLEGLNAYISFAYDTYILVCDNKFSKIAQNRKMAEFTNKLGFGMLLRHAVEAITSSLAAEIGIDPSDKTVDERLIALKGHIVCGYDTKIEQTLYRAKQLANEVAHPNLSSKPNDSFMDLMNFYHNHFREVLDWYIANMRTLSVRKFGSYTGSNTVHFRKTVYKYLIALKARMEKFSIKEKVTYTLLRGCLIRQLNECAVNLWAYNQGLEPNNSDSVPESLHLKLISLSHLASNNGHSVLNQVVVDNLFKIKDVSNCLMHIDNFNINYIISKQEEIVNLHPLVERECAPDVIKAKFATVKGVGRQRQSKPGLISLLLCGLAGWFGAHHFYSGNIKTGVAFLIQSIWCIFIGVSTFLGEIPPIASLIFCLGTMISPLISLFGMFNGTFRSNKWGFYLDTSLSASLALAFGAFHIYIDYLFITKILF